MTESTQIRSLTPTAQDYQALAEIAASCPPMQALDYERRAADEWRALDQAFAAAGQPASGLLVELDGQAVGYAYTFPITWAPPPDRHWCIIRVLPAYQRRGIGSRLYARLLAALQARAARALLLEVDESLAALRPALERRGFVALLDSWYFTLDPRTCDVARFAAAQQKLGDLRITTLASELARGAEWLPQLHELYLRVGGDVPIPITPLGVPPAAWLREQALELPEAFFIVCDGPRYVGMSYLHRDAAEPGRLFQRITAIHPTYRGRGMAMALKLATIAYAQRTGCHEIFTAVESNNPSMLAINRKLGFEQRAGLTLYERAVEVTR